MHIWNLRACCAFDVSELYIWYWSTASLRIWNRCFLQTFSSCKFKRLCRSRTTATTKTELFVQVTLCLGILEGHCVGSRGKNFVHSIAISEKRIIVSVTLFDLGFGLTSKMELIVTCCHRIEAYPGLLQTSKIECFKEIVNS